MRVVLRLSLFLAPISTPARGSDRGLVSKLKRLVAKPGDRNSLRARLSD